MEKATPTQKKAQQKLDKAILKRIEKAIQDPDNCELSAAFINAVSKRYENIKPIVIQGSGSPRERIRENLRLVNDGKLPPIDTNSDDRATRSA